MFSEEVITNRERRPEPPRHLGRCENEQGTERTEYNALRVVESEIRVVQLSPGLPWSPLSGTLLRTALRSKKSTHDATDDLNSVSGERSKLCYEALSYVWGPTIRNHHIDLVSIGQIPITDNLAQALKRLRRLEEVRTIWIDAVCINQNDPIERGQQVQIMGQIYSNASRVLVWLGDCNERWEVLTQTYLFQNDFGSSIYHGHNQLIENNPLDMVDDWRIRDLVAAIKGAKYGYWWERAWIVQEFALAHCAPIV